MLNPVNELLSHKVCKASHAHHPSAPLAGDALQTLILLNLLKHVSDTNGTHINTGITAHRHQDTQTQAMRFSLFITDMFLNLTTQLQWHLQR